MTDSKLDSRRRRHETLSARLSGLSDADLAARLESAQWRRGWGETAVIEVGGQAVFVKKIPLPDIERGRPGSTANHYGLPTFYQYGVGSAGFGAWRELSAMTRASDWALSGECDLFPIIHHWRVMPGEAKTLSALAERVDWLVDYWNKSEAVRARLQGMLDATAGIVVFMEHAAGDNLMAWLRGVVETRDFGRHTEALILTTMRQLREAAAFMTARGMQHFDLHHGNLLTDGEQLYIADFGLALCEDFDLSAEERAFYETHRLYDRAYVETALNWWLGPPPPDPEKPPPPDLGSALRAALEPGRPIAAILGPFLDKLREDKTIPYPGREIAAAIGAAGA